jgi:hypothetical protein
MAIKKKSRGYNRLSGSLSTINTPAIIKKGKATLP